MPASQKRSEDGKERKAEAGSGDGVSGGHYVILPTFSTVPTYVKYTKTVKWVILRWEIIINIK